MKAVVPVWPLLVVPLVLPQAALADEHACASGATLHVRLMGFESSRGSAALAIYASERDHDAREDALHSASVTIEDGEATWRVTDLPCGSYSVLAYHDENGNGRLDTGPFGVPQEKYGASNDARAPFGPPRFDDARFDVDSNGAAIRILLR